MTVSRPRRRTVSCCRWRNRPTPDASLWLSNAVQGVVTVTDRNVLERIDAWESGGLIDGSTAERLRAEELGRPPSAALATSQPRSFFGPAPAVAEVLAYVGGAFVLAAWYVLMGSRVPPGSDGVLLHTASFAMAGFVALLIGAAIRSHGPRGLRAAGVLFVVATANAYGAGFSALSVANEHSLPTQLIVGGVLALLVGGVLRRLHPALLTQLGLIGAVLALADGIAAVIRDRVLPSGQSDGSIPEMVMDLGVWLGAAILLGILGRLESRTRTDDAAHRSNITRFAAGMTTVISTASILTRSGPVGPVDSYQWARVLQPIVAEVAIGIAALFLLGLALRRAAPAYLYPGAIGIVLALSDFNASYVANQVGTGLALLLEGVVILGAGLLAERLRRRLRVG